MPKFGNFGRDINGKLWSAWKFSGQSGSSPEVVLFDRSVCSDQTLPFHFQNSRFQSHFAMQWSKCRSKRKWIASIRLETLFQSYHLMFTDFWLYGLAKWKAHPGVAGKSYLESTWKLLLPTQARRHLGRSTEPVRPTGLIWTLLYNFDDSNKKLFFILLAHEFSTMHWISYGINRFLLIKKRRRRKRQALKRWYSIVLIPCRSIWQRSSNFSGVEFYGI